MQCECKQYDSSHGVMRERRLETDLDHFSMHLFVLSFDLNFVYGYASHSKCQFRTLGAGSFHSIRL